MAVAKTDEAAESHNRVVHAAGYLVDHQVVDLADFAAFQSIDASVPSTSSADGLGWAVADAIGQLLGFACFDQVFAPATGDRS